MRSVRQMEELISRCERTLGRSREIQGILENGKWLPSRLLHQNGVWTVLEWRVKWGQVERAV